MTAKSDIDIRPQDYAGWADKIRGDSFPPDDGFYKIGSQKPLEVCAGVTAWNGSLHFLAWKAAPALACGNTSIIKPSEKSPLGTMAVAYLIEAAGFPPGVFQVFPGEILRHAVFFYFEKLANVQEVLVKAFSRYFRSEVVREHDFNISRES